MLRIFAELAPHRAVAAMLVLGLLGFGIARSFQPVSVVIEAGLNVGKGSYYDTASKYKKILERHGVSVVLRENPDTTRIISNVNRPDGAADIGFTISVGQESSFPNVGAAGISELQPLFIFTNAAMGDVGSLADLRGKRIATLKPGTITNLTTQLVLKRFDIGPENSKLVFLDQPTDLVDALTDGWVDAIFLIVGPGNPFVVKLMTTPGLRPFDMVDAQTVARDLGFLRTVVIPRGSFDLNRSIPAQPFATLAGPVEVIMRRDIDPAVAYLLMDAMNDVHRRSTQINDAGAFPALKDTNIALHPVAEAYSKSGVPWIYRRFPPRLASIVDEYGDLLIGLVLFRNVLGYIAMIDGLFRKLVGAIGSLWRRCRGRRGIVDGPPRHSASG